MQQISRGVFKLSIPQTGFPLIFY